MVLVRQHFPDRRIADLPAAVGRQMEAAALAVAPGASVAIGVGSRGVENIATIVKAVVEFWHDRGCRPYLFPAMGSHGAATAEGQTAVLESYGISETSMGCPIQSTLEVDRLATTSLGFEVFAGRDAWQADHVMLINRVKWHTSFVGSIESGLTKMMAIGLGKQEGARTSHTYARRYGMEAVIRSIAAEVLKTGKLLGGLAILEDAHHHTAHIEMLPAAILLAREEQLLAQTKTWMAQLPLRDIDVLIVDKIGKNISGTGMDAKIINRGAAVDLSPDAVLISTIFVRDLSKASYGSAMGIGMADVMHNRIHRKIDVGAGLANAMTTGTLAQIRLPVSFASDRECLKIALRTAGSQRIVWIRSTMDLETIFVSANAAANLETEGDPFDLAFDAAGDLIPPAIHSQRAVV